MSSEHLLLALSKDARFGSGAPPCYCYACALCAVRGLRHAPAGLMRDLSVAPSALEAAVSAVKGRKRVTDQVRCYGAVLLCLSYC